MTDQPTRHDLTAADMDLFLHDARKHEQRRAQGITDTPSFPNHQPYNCPTGKGACPKCVPYSPQYQCRIEGCEDVAVEGARCEKHVRRWAA